MTPKEYLKQGYRLDKRIDSMLLEVEELKSMLYSIPSPQYGERVQTTRNTDSPFLRKLIKVEEFEEKVNEQIDRCVALKEQMGQAISTVQNADEEMVLRYRYIHGKTWEQIAEELYADVRTIYRWHSLALKKMRLPEHPIKIQ